MTSAALMEVLASLTLQSGALLLVAGWLTRQHRDPVRDDRLWSLTFLSILVLSGCSLTVPHLRWVVFSSLAPATWQPTLGSLLERLSTYLVGLWLAGGAIGLARLAAGMIRGALLVQRSPLLPRSRYGALQSVPGEIAFRTSPQIGSPFLWQFHQPTIVLPADVLAFDADTTAAILNHEVAHFRAGHPLQLFLQRLVGVLFWFHPLVWWGARQAAHCREIRCDHEAVSSATEAESLLKGLILLVEARGRTRRPGLSSLPFLGASRELETRAASLLARFTSDDANSHRPPSFRSSLLILAGTVAGVFLLGWLPVNPQASQRSHLSPWPVWSASAMDLLGVEVRDYEIDGHRLRGH